MSEIEKAWSESGLWLLSQEEVDEGSSFETEKALPADVESCNNEVKLAKGEAGDEASEDVKGQPIASELADVWPSPSMTCKTSEGGGEEPIDTELELETRLVMLL